MDSATMRAAAAPDLRRLAEVACAALSALPRRAHADWIALAPLPGGPGAAPGEPLLREWLLARYDLRWPDLSAAAHALERLWMLPPDVVRRICATACAQVWLAYIRRSIDGSVRRRVARAVGPDAFDRLMAQPAGRPGPLVAPMPEFDEAGMAADGWWLLRRSHRWQDARCRRLVSLLLPRPGGPRRRFPQGHAPFGKTLRDQVMAHHPEQAWLFG